VGLTMRRLAIFDIDGTLTDTNGVDDDCYRTTIAETLGIAPEAVDWSGAAHVTDNGIFDWLCEVHGAATVSPTDRSATCARFVGRLSAALDEHPEQFVEIAGAKLAIQRLVAANWAIAVATGGWGASARLKLRAAGIDVPDAVIACTDDAVARADIVSIARRRAEAHYGCSFERVVTIGDGPWDVRAAATLDLPFVGIATNDRASELRTLGASTVLPNYVDLDAVQHAFEHATPPA